MQLSKRKQDWWKEPELAKKRVSVPRHYKNIDPLSSDVTLPKRGREQMASFKPSRKWTRYNRLQAVDVGYLVPVYDLRQIALRYGLSQNSQTYFRRHILPEPFDLVRRRSVQAHHWSRFTLMALDLVLQDLEQRGYTQFFKSFEEHIDLVHYGTDYLAGYYADKNEYDIGLTGDEFGVSWL